MADPSELRVADADREQLVEELREHALAGRLSSEEMEERIGSAYRARTRGDLDERLREPWFDPAGFDAAWFGGELLSEFCGADILCSGFTGVADWVSSDELGTACGRAAGALPLLQKVVLLRHVTYTSTARRIATTAPT